MNLENGDQISLDTTDVKANLANIWPNKNWVEGRDEANELGAACPTWIVITSRAPFSDKIPRFLECKRSSRISWPKCYGVSDAIGEWSKDEDVLAAPLWPPW